MKLKFAFLALSIVFSAQSQAAAPYVYSCEPHFMNSGGFDDTLKVTVTASEIKMKNTATFWTGTAAFHSTASGNKLQYQGLQALNSQPMYAQYLLDKGLLTGISHGQMKAQATGSSFIQGSFECTRQ